tara:strand:- start:138 stop:362 length:225 start_codon:yes stop_codon:yes gene_type:complete
METVGGMFCFLSLPDMKIRQIPQVDTVAAIDSDLLDVVEKLPSGIYSVCCEQYRNNDKTHGTDEDVHGNIPSHT